MAIEMRWQSGLMVNISFKFQINAHVPIQLRCGRRLGNGLEFLHYFINADCIISDCNCVDTIKKKIKGRKITERSFRWG